MSDEYLDATYSQIRDVIQRLQSPIHDLPTLYTLLAAPLDSLQILAPQFYNHTSGTVPTGAISLPKHFPPLQRVLLEHIVPVWGHTLDQENSYALIQQYFAPDLFFSGNPNARQIAVYAYSTILSLPLTEHSVRLLVQLTKLYPVDVLWDTLVHAKKRPGSEKWAVTWEDCVRDVCAVPAKVANFFGAQLKSSTVPSELESATYFNRVCSRFETIVSSLSSKPSEDELASLTYLLTKLASIGVFPPNPPSDGVQPSFWAVILPSRRVQSLSPSSNSAWHTLLSSISSAITLQTILISLLSHLDLVSVVVDSLDGSDHTRVQVKREALLLREVCGAPTKDNEILESLFDTMIGKQWDVAHARAFVCWASGSSEKRETKGLQLLLDRAVDVWTTPDHIKHSLLRQHQYLTALIILALSCFSKSSSAGPSKLATSPAFIRSISTYISHMDASVRRCGMLVAEEVARACGKELKFGDWDGEGEGREWCRGIRQLAQRRDVDAFLENLSSETPATLQAGNIPPKDDIPVEPVMPTSLPKANHEADSDDESLQGYASSAASSAPSSPRFTAAELDEIEKDPTLNVGRKKIPRPVYLGQLGQLVRPTTGVKSQEDEQAVERMQIALDVGEELIRRKRGYGSELEENAVNLVYGYAGLQDNYDLEGFAEKRQAALTALVACSPRKAAPALIEHFFMNQYSAEQRYAMLTALALGARELASLPIPESTVSAKRLAFPSKHLPPALHSKYITAGDQQAANPVRSMLEGITQKAVEGSKEAAEEKIPAFVRERKLRLRPASKISEVNTSLSRGLQSMHLQPQATVAFTDVAAEFFICPLISRFWQFLRDEQGRESRTAHQPVLHQYRGSGTGLVLNAFVLSQFVASLAVLVHAAHNAPEWLAVIAPDALELAVTLGTRPLSSGEGLDDDEDSAGETSEGKKEAALLTNCLELAVVTIDGCLELDGGKTLGLEHTALLLAAGEWGSEMLSRLEKGVKVLGGGGKQEVKLRRAAAGLVLKVDELTTRWRRSMVTMGYEQL